MTVRLEAGFPLGEVKSHHHEMRIEESSANGRVLRLAKGAVPANRDFELTWTGLQAKTPAVGLFHEEVAGEDYVLAFVTPPVADSQEANGQAAKPRREIIFVIDTSGSMGGTSIVQARKSLLYGLKRLTPRTVSTLSAFRRPTVRCFRTQCRQATTTSHGPRILLRGLKPKAVPRCCSRFWQLSRTHVCPAAAS